MSLVYKLGKALKAEDAVAGPVNGSLHWAGRGVEKTHCGGFLSLVAKLYVYYIALEAFHGMLVRKGTAIRSHEADLEAVESHKIGDLNTLFYAVVDHNQNMHTLAELAPYVDVEAALNSYTYERPASGEIKETLTTTRAALKDCEESDFAGDKEEREYYETTVRREGLKLLCLTDEAMAMKVEGTIQSKKVDSLPNSYFAVQVFRCDNSTRAAGNKCASPAAVDAWLYARAFRPYAFDVRPNLLSFGEVLIRDFQQYRGVKLKPGAKTDYWFRFTPNVYERTDQALFSPKKTSKFSSLRLVYETEYVLPKEEESKAG